MSVLLFKHGIVPRLSKYPSSSYPHLIFSTVLFRHLIRRTSFVALRSDDHVVLSTLRESSCQISPFGYRFTWRFLVLVQTERFLLHIANQRHCRFSARISIWDQLCYMSRLHLETMVSAKVRSRDRETSAEVVCCKSYMQVETKASSYPLPCLYQTEQPNAS